MINLKALIIHRHTIAQLLRIQVIIHQFAFLRQFVIQETEAILVSSINSSISSPVGGFVVSSRSSKVIAPVLHCTCNNKGETKLVRSLLYVICGNWGFLGEKCHNMRVRSTGIDHR